MSQLRSKTIWIINQYASTPETGMGGRHYYLAKELANQGHKVYLIAAGYTHLLRKPPELNQEYTFQKIEYGFDFVWIRMQHYRNAHDKKRVLNWFVFAWKLRLLDKVINGKPDIILFSSPSLIPFLGAKYLARKLKSKLVFEVRDIWPLTLIELGHFSPKHPFIRFMQWIEDIAYRDSEIVLSNLFNAVEHMVSRGMNKDKFHWIPNGIDLNETEHYQNLTPDVLASLPKNRFIVGYTGTIGTANALDDLISAASILQDNHEIAFVLVGSGKEKEVLSQKAKGLDNVFFFDPVPKAQIQSMLSMFDVCYIGWKNESIYRFGIAPNKLPEYLISGKPIIHAYSGGYDIVDEINAGITVQAENREAIAQAVLDLKSFSIEKRLQMGNCGREFALENFDFVKLAEKLSRVLGMS